MILDDIIEKIKEAQFPEFVPDDLNIGNSDYSDDRNGQLFSFYPSDTCSAFANIRGYQDDACVTVHTHVIEVYIDKTQLNIHNSQIIVFDYYFFDDTIEYQKADTRGARIGLGFRLAGPIGATIGLASSFGKGNKHIVSHNLIISYWNLETKAKEFIVLENEEGVKDNVVPKLVEYWREQVEINKETGRKPMGDDKAGVEKNGCLGVLIPFIVAGLYFCCELVELVLC